MRLRRRRAATLAAAALVSAVSFVLLTSTAKTSSLQIRGTVATNFRPAYDILVRPHGSKTRIEQHAGLVRPNYLSGIFGGISLRQWHEVRRIRGVEVAAPIANIGYILPFTNVMIGLEDVLNRDPFQLYRVDYSNIADHGRSRYPGRTEFVYYTRRDRMQYSLQGASARSLRGRKLDINTPFYVARPSDEGPFSSLTFFQLLLCAFARRGDRCRDWRHVPSAGEGQRLL